MPDNPGPRNARTRAAAAGQPQTNDNAPQAARRPPTDAELDERDRMKSGPRRQAGPPLEGDNPEPVPMEAVRAAAMPRETNPEGQ